MEPPDIFFVPYRRDDSEDQVFAAIGRALAYATRFEWNCRALAKMIAIQEDRAILRAPDSEQTAFFERLEGTLAKQIRRIVPEFISVPDSAHDAVFTRAREARNRIAHELTVSVERQIEDRFRRARLISELRELTRDVASADVSVCVALSQLNGDALLSRLAEYPDDIAEWVVSGGSTSVRAEDGKNFVDPHRIGQLRAATSSDWDLSQLASMCDELNVGWAQGLWRSCSGLTRAILDHVPPMFGCRTFTEVANNYAGSKSFREAMQYLDKAARKIADAHLHTQVRESEVLPTATQVNFGAPLDMLLAEVVRISRSGAPSRERLNALVARASELMEDFLCPECGSPIERRDVGSGSVPTDLGEYDVVWEDVRYECGRATHDGEEIAPCMHSGGPRAVS